MKPIIKDKRLIIFTIVAIISGSFIWFRYQRPYFTYDLEMYEQLDEAEEMPLNITSYDKETINYDLIFGGAYNEYTQADMKNDLRFFNYPPFFEYGKTLVIVVSNPRYKLTEDLALFKLDGVVSNLRPGEYKLRVEDSNKNLVDERTFVIGENGLTDTIENQENDDGTVEGPTTPYDNVGDVNNDIDLPDELNGEDKDKDDPSKTCEVDSDCVPVACGCTCNGGGGVNYEDVVNKTYEDVWYYQRACEQPKICPQVVCEPNEVKCVDNICKVIELTEEDIGTKQN